MRAFLITLLLLQALVAQAGVPGMSCTHATTGTPSHSAIAGHSHAQQTTTAGRQANDEPPTYERCCCTFMGHCSSTAVGSSTPGGAQFSPATHPASPIVDALARGFDTPPYRPPSLAV